MARDPIGRVLRAFCSTQSEAWPAVDVASHRWRVLAHAENLDGQIEGLNANFLFAWVGNRLCLPDRQMIGELCLVRFLILAFVLALNSGRRNNGGASCEHSPCDLV